MNTVQPLSLTKSHPGFVARPVVKWAGGKSQLLPEISSRLPKQLAGGEIDRYIEPFVGGGAVFFHLQSINPGLESILIDVNSDLINLYFVIQEHPEDLLSELEHLEQLYHQKSNDLRAKLFYDIRTRFNSDRQAPANTLKSKICTAADLVFLNRTCFNGLYRTNSKGHFNVPHGRYSRPCIADHVNIVAASQALQAATLIVGDYHECRKYVKGSTFVYFDPPYRPLSQTSAFVSYAKNGFNDDNQRDLAELFKTLSMKSNVYLMLSNSDPRGADPGDDFFDELYRDFRLSRVKAGRNINSKGSGRGKISEILVTNYE